MREKYKIEDPEEVVPKVRRILDIRWKGAANMTITLIEEGQSKYKVNKTYNKFGEEELEEGSDPVDVGKTTTNLVNPDMKNCTCGKWQEFWYPCRHAVGYF